MKKRTRKNEQVCLCSAYKFPHRFGGGKCTGKYIVVEYFNETFGKDGECVNCALCNVESGYPYCEVIEGGEPVTGCQIFRDYIRYHSIKYKSTLI